MLTFSYEAISESGVNIKGTLQAESAAAAENILAGRGYIPIQVSAKPGRKSAAGTEGAYTGYVADTSLWKKIRSLVGGLKTADLIIFTKQFRSMLKAGVPIIRLLQVLEAQTQNPILRNAIYMMIVDVRQGATLHDALDKHPRLFSPLYRSMIKAGEMSGTVPEVLARLAYIIEHEAKIKADVKAALQYPIIVLIVLGIAFFVLLTFVIPRFAQIFLSAGLELPLPTKIAINLYEFLKNYWPYVVGGLISTVVGLGYYIKTNQGRFILDNFLLKSPILGPLFLKAAMSRFASIFAILHASGIQVMTAMPILSETVGNTAIARQLDRVREMIEEGQGIAQPLRSAKYFTPMVVDMIAIGEESGNIEEMLREVTNHYDDEVNYEVKALSDAVGPILMVGLAGVVGFFALAIFLPMWDLTKTIQ